MTRNQQDHLWDLGFQEGLNEIDLNRAIENTPQLKGLKDPVRTNALTYFVEGFKQAKKESRGSWV